MKKIIISLFVLLAGCASTTEDGETGVGGRKQFMMMSSQELDAMAAQSYMQVKQDASRKGALDKNPALVSRVVNISKRLIPHTAIFRKDALSWAWEVHVTTSPELNAYCMPGGKIMFYSGIIEKLNLSDGEIAAIMGHEISHALREHSRERMSQQKATGLGLGVVFALTGINPNYAGLANTASNLVVGLPHGRKQETEADEIGLELMARAGYDPREAVNLWKKMSQASGGSKPPEILSTHPADTTRIASIEGLLPKVMPIYQRSRM